MRYRHHNLPSAMSAARQRLNSMAKYGRLREPSAYEPPPDSLPSQRTVIESKARQAPYLIATIERDSIGEAPYARFYAGTGNLARAIRLASTREYRAIVQTQDGAIAFDNDKPMREE